MDIPGAACCPGSGYGNFSGSFRIPGVGSVTDKDRAAVGSGSPAENGQQGVGRGCSPVHRSQAGIFNKAIESAISSRKWNRAVQLVQGQPPEIARPYYKQIAKHYAEVRQHDLAEKYFIQAGEYVDAFEMYVRANKWDNAYQVISRYLPESEYTMLYV